LEQRTNFSNLIAQRKVTLFASNSFPLSQVKEAFEALSSRHTLARSFQFLDQDVSTADKQHHFVRALKSSVSTSDG
jgi:hypothetical protein